MTKTSSANPAASRSGTLGKILENTGWLLAARGVGAVLSLIYLGMAIRSLGPTSFGQFVLVLGIGQAIAAFVGFQSWQAVVRFGVPHLRDGEARPLGRVVAFCLTLDIGAALVGCVLVTGGVMLLGPRFGWTPDLQRDALIFAFALLLCVRSAAIGVLRLHDRFGAGALADAMTPITRMIGAVVVVLTGPTISHFLYAWAIAEVVTALTYWVLAIRLAPGVVTAADVRGLKSVRGENEGLWHFVLVTNAGETLASAGKQVAVLLVGLFVGPAAAGSYRVAHQLAQALANVTDMLSRAIFSELTRVHHGAGTTMTRKLFRHSSGLAAVAAVLIVLAILLVGKPVLLLIAGPDYVGVYPLLVILGLAAALDMAGVSFEPALLATGRIATSLVLRLLSTLLLLALFVVLLPQYGYMGAGIATLIAAFAGLIIFGFAAWRAVRAE